MKTKYAFLLVLFLLLSGCGDIYDPDGEERNLARQNPCDKDISLCYPAKTEAPQMAPSSCPNGCSSPPAGCEIKGNISAKAEKIYHLPGDKYYAKTVIETEKGERWFCTRQEAEQNGWRRTKK